MRASSFAFACLAGALITLPAAARAQLTGGLGGASSGYDAPALNPNGGPNDLRLYDLNGDGKIEDWEREKVNFRLLSDMDLNHDGVIDWKDRKLAKEKIKAEKEARLAELKKYDLNHDGKLDAHENELRIADEARERSKQKPSQATVELSKPMVAY